MDENLVKEYFEVRFQGRASRTYGRFCIGPNGEWSELLQILSQIKTNLPIPPESKNNNSPLALNEAINLKIDTEKIMTLTIKKTNLLLEARMKNMDEKMMNKSLSTFRTKIRSYKRLLQTKFVGHAFITLLMGLRLISTKLQSCANQTCIY